MKSKLISFIILICLCYCSSIKLSTSAMAGVKKIEDLLNKNIGGLDGELYELIKENSFIGNNKEKETNAVKDNLSEIQLVNMQIPNNNMASVFIESSEKDSLADDLTDISFIEKSENPLSELIKLKHENEEKKAASIFEIIAKDNKHNVKEIDTLERKSKKIRRKSKDGKKNRKLKLRKKRRSSGKKRNSRARKTKKSKNENESLESVKNKDNTSQRKIESGLSLSKNNITKQSNKSIESKQTDDFQTKLNSLSEDDIIKLGEKILENKEQAKKISNLLDKIVKKSN